MDFIRESIEALDERPKKEEEKESVKEATIWTTQEGDKEETYHVYVQAKDEGEAKQLVDTLGKHYEVDMVERYPNMVAVRNVPGTYELGAERAAEEEVERILSDAGIKLGESRQRVRGKFGRSVKEKHAFQPIDITILEEGDNENEYFELAKKESIRSERHLSQALSKTIKEAMEKVDKPFDSVDILFRRKPIEEKKDKDMKDKEKKDKEDKKKADKEKKDKEDKKDESCEQAEQELLAACHLWEKGRVKEDFVQKKAEAAVKAGSFWDRIKGLVLNGKAQKIVEKVFEAMMPVWPPKEALNKIVGKEVIVDTVWQDRWQGRLSRKGEGKFSIKTRSGDKPFFPKDVNRILVSQGG